MTERPNVPQILADELRAAGLDPIVAAGIVAKVGQAIMAQQQWDDMERWRAEQAAADTTAGGGEQGQ